MAVNILLACVVVAAVMAMASIWFPGWFRSDTGARFMYSAFVLLVSAFVAGFVMWVVG